MPATGEAKREIQRRHRARQRGEEAPLRIRPWTHEEEGDLREAYAVNWGRKGGWLKTLAARIGRDLPNVVRKARQLGIGHIGARRCGARDQTTIWPLLPPTARLGGKRSKSALWLRSLPESQQSRGKGGRRADLDNRYFRSRWEANYARYLNFKGVRWEYEPTTFSFEGIKRGTRSYTPDFWLPEEGVFHEVKGWMDPKSRVKLERMAKYHPKVVVVVIGADWFRQAQRGGLAGVIPGWESGRNGR